MRKPIFRFGIILLLVMNFFIGFSQQYSVKSYTLEDGLATRNINDACQDKIGNMWFATNVGVTKYDGFRFTNFDKTNGVPEQSYRKIKCDKNGVIWVAPFSLIDTLIYFKDNICYKIPPLELKYPSAELTSFDIVYKNNEPSLSVGCNFGLYILENHKWKNAIFAPGNNKNIVSEVIAKANKIYISSNTGIYIYENGKIDSSLNQLFGQLEQNIIAINFESMYSPDEKLWILSEEWLGYIQYNKFKLVTNKFQLPHPSIFPYAFVESDKKGNIIFGNIWAKYYITRNNNTPKPLMYDNGFSSHGATSVFVDREQNFWITDTRGINKINNLNILNYYKKNGLLDDEVTAIAEMDDGRMVFGHNNGLTIFNNGSFKTIEFPDNKINTRRVTDIMKDNVGNIWFTSINKGLGKMRPNGVITWYSSYKYPTISAVHQDKTGRIWVGAEKYLLYLQNDILVEYQPFNESKNNIRKIFSDQNDGIFVSGIRGLWHINKNECKKIQTCGEKNSDNIFAYYRAKNGIEYIGAENGLYTLTEGITKKVQFPRFEIKNPIFFIVQDNKNNFWLGSNNGVYKWDGSGEPETYNIHNGLAGWETNRAAGMLDSKGRIWIGTDRGLSCFEPDYNKTAIPVPVINLLSVEDNQGNHHPLNQKNFIENSDNSLTFHFNGISFFNEELMEYRYKLEGYDDDWLEIKQSMIGNIKYIGLKPGKYTFCVSAKNFAGNWSEIVRSETIKIKNPLYLRWWFMLLILMTIFGIIYILTVIRYQQSHNKQLKKEIQEREKIQKDLVESRKKYHDLVELLPETIYEADSDGKIVYMNTTGFNQFGLKPFEANKPVFVNDIIAKESINIMTEHNSHVIKNLRESKITITGLRKNGTTFPLSVHTVPIIFNERCIGTLGLLSDLTEQKKYEEQLKKNSDDLKALNSSKDKFFSIIAHDLRSPFTSFLGFTEILEEEFQSLSQDDLQSIVSSMRKSAVNLYQLLENLLEWSLLHRDVTKFKPQVIQLHRLTNNCIELMADIAKHKKITVINKIPEGTEIYGDSHMIQTIFRNLLSNALKFTERGGVIRLSISNSTEQSIVYAVKDSGIGIQPELKEKIFNFDTNNKTKGTDGEFSTGLGLILCREFIEKHGGKIWVESEPGSGSTFFFTLDKTHN